MGKEGFANFVALLLILMICLLDSRGSVANDKIDLDMHPFMNSNCYEFTQFDGLRMYAWSDFASATPQPLTLLLLGSIFLAHCAALSGLRQQHLGELYQQHHSPLP